VISDRSDVMADLMYFIFVGRWRLRLSANPVSEPHGFAKDEI
jgi:hypothetical protein